MVAFDRTTAAPSALGTGSALPGASPSPCASDVPGGAGVPDGVAGSASAAVVDDPPGTLTCARLADAVRRGSLMAPGVVDAVGAAEKQPRVRQNGDNL